MKQFSFLKNNILAILVLFSFFAISTNGNAVDAWELEGAAGFSAGSADYTSIAVDGNNVPYVVYMDGGNSGKATVMKFDGTSWVPVGTAGFSAGGASYTSIAIDGNNVPYVVYSDAGNSYTATVMKFNGTSWVTVGTAGFSAGVADYTDIAIDGNNVPYVVYQDGGNGSKATVMKFNGTIWVPVGTAGFSAGQSPYTSIAIDGNNVPYVVYSDFGNNDKATVMKFDGTSWDTVGNAGFSDGFAYYTSIAIDGNNVPYVVYYDGGNSNKATVMKFDGTSWATVGTVGFSAGEAYFTSIAIDGNNVPYVIYTDGGNAYKATVMKFDGTSWDTVGTAGFSAGDAWYNSIAIDGNNVPYVVYSDGNKSNKATVMKFEEVNLATAPEVSTSATIIDITTNSATINGEVTADGGAELTARGFVISSTEAVPTLLNATVHIDAIATVDIMTKGVSGLNSETLYYFRAYATNSLGTSYGEVESFSTSAIEPTVQSKNITFHSITKNRIGLRWTKGDGSNRIAIASTSSLNEDSYLLDGATYTAADYGVNELVTTGVYVVYNGNNTTCLVNGLARNTTYHFRIMEYNGSGNTSNYLNSSALNNPNSRKTSKKESEEITAEIKSSINLYPNPANDLLNMELNLPFDGGEMTIFNDAGAEMFRTTDFDSDFKLNTNNFTNGSYHIMITNGNEIIYNSFVIKR